MNAERRRTGIPRIKGDYADDYWILFCSNFSEADIEADIIVGSPYLITNFMRTIEFRIRINPINRPRNPFNQRNPGSNF